MIYWGVLVAHPTNCVIIFAVRIVPAPSNKIIRFLQYALILFCHLDVHRVALNDQVLLLTRRQLLNYLKERIVELIAQW